MKYCPSCKYEYEDNIVKCSDCGVDLVSVEEFEAVQATPESNEGEGEIIKIGGFDWQMLTELEHEQQAEQVREIMKQFTIPIEIRNKNGKVLIYAPKVQYQTALSVIHQVFAMSANASGAGETLEQDFDSMDHDMDHEEEGENDGFGAKLLMVLGLVAVAAAIYSFLS